MRRQHTAIYRSCADWVGEQLGRPPTVADVHADARLRAIPGDRWSSYLCMVRELGRRDVAVAASTLTAPSRPGVSEVDADARLAITERDCDSSPQDDVPEHRPKRLPLACRQRPRVLR